MVKNTSYGYEYYECSNCGQEVDQLEDYCQTCSHAFQKRTYYISNDKFIAHSFIELTIGSQNTKVILATLENQKLGIRKFVVPDNKQIANRIKFFVINGNRGYLEDGLIQKKLIVLNDFVEISIPINEEQEKVFIHNSLLL